MRAGYGATGKALAAKTMAVLNDDARLAPLLAGERVEVLLPESAVRPWCFGVDERPLECAAARAWIKENARWEPDRERFLGLMNLMENDEERWPYESW